ncbi:MAG: hypothetical protein CVU84_00530 [Firmicutes bacterium HGW-Firmicutes-1]|jgi:hypothetical protein|nr:MAG: hypothetical protein CVU84_00530 [Firmicutes bacterium HGW-Firmicutes-1]
MTAKKEVMNDGTNQLNHKSKSKVVAVIVTIAVICAVMVAIGKNDSKSNEEIVFDSTVKTVFLDTYETTNKIEFSKLDQEAVNDPETKLMLNVIKDINVNTIHRYNAQTREIELVFDIRIKDISTIEGQVFANDQLIALDIPLLYPQPLYMTWEVFLDKYGTNNEQAKILLSSLKENINTKAYENVYAFEAQKYVDLSKAFILNTLSQKPDKEKITINENQVACKKYTMNADAQELVDFLNDILNTMLLDKKLGYAMNTMNSVFLFDENSLEKLNLNDYLDVTLDSSLFIDKRSVIRKGEHILRGSLKGFTDMPIKYELNVNTTVIKANEAVELKGFDMADAINVSLLTKEELSTLFKDIEHTLQTNIDKNRLYDLLQMDKEMNP